MTIVSRKEVGKERWNAFCDAHEGAWWWWRGEWLDYQVARGTRDLSFGVEDAGRLVAICPLLLEERDGQRSFTMDGHPGPAPLFEKWPSVVISQQKIESLICEHEIIRQAYRHSTFADSFGEWPEMWSDISWHTQILDLTQPVETLHAGIRKSYTSLINHVNGSHDVTVDLQGDLIEPFRQLHLADAGRETRPIATWNMQRQWCKDGYGMTVGASLSGVLVAATYWIVYKGFAYFASSASISRNVIHSLIWRAIIELKKLGVTLLELGWTDYDKSEKGIGVAFLKTGFGGKPRSIHAVERRWR